MSHPSTLRTHQVAFNTGAHYSSHGQRIAVWLRKTETGYVDLCCLVDFDRLICCHFPARLTSALSSPSDLGLHATHMYQWGQYDLGFSPGLDSQVRIEMNTVLANGYAAFIQSPGVTLLTAMASRLRELR